MNDEQAANKAAVADHSRTTASINIPTTVQDAEKHLLEIAQKAEAVAGSHITGMTFHHDDLQRLSAAIRLMLGKAN